MNYYLDTEFHEYHKQQKVCGIKIGKAIPTIDLISIGIVSEDNREYYAICKEFNVEDAWNSFQYKTEMRDAGMRKVEVKEHWLRENVLRPIYFELLKLDGDEYNDIYIKELGDYEYKLMVKLLAKYGKTKSEIADGILEFIKDYKYDDKWEEGERFDSAFGNGMNNTYYFDTNDGCFSDTFIGTSKSDTPVFYAYFADYDWVVFAQLYGKMMNLPAGYPMYCKDLKQVLDDKAGKMDGMIDHANNRVVEYNNNKEQIAYIKDHPNYPKQANEHNALDDALFNKKLHSFLNNL